MSLWQKFHVVSQRMPFPSLKRVGFNTRSRLFPKLVWLALGLGGVALAFLPWQQTAQGTGKVVAFSPNERTQTISASLDGRVQKWYVAEGATVKAGDLLVDLSDNDPEIISRLREEQRALARRASATLAAAKTASINIERQQSLVENGLSAPRSLEQAQLDHNRLLVDQANALAELARVDVRLARQLTQSVTAPIDGTIQKITAGQGGHLVKQGQTLAILVPTTDSRAVELWIDGNDVPLIFSGAKVRLQFEGWPAVQFSGWPSVAVGTFGGTVTFIDASDDGQGKFRVVILPDNKESWPKSRFLRQGVRTHGWVQLEQVSLGFEVWRRFNGFPPALNENDHQARPIGVGGEKD